MTLIRYKQELISTLNIKYLHVGISPKENFYEIDMYYFNTCGKSYSNKVTIQFDSLNDIRKFLTTFQKYLEIVSFNNKLQNEFEIKTRAEQNYDLEKNNFNT